MIQNRTIVYNYKKIITILLLNILLLWILTIKTTHINGYSPDSLYYFKNLPLFYWIGIAFIFIVLILDIYFEKNLGMKIGTCNDILLIMLAVLYLDGLTSFVYSNPRTLDTYATSVVIANITNKITLSDQMYYTQFQGSMWLFYIFSQCSKLSTFILSKYYPIYLMTMLSVFSYLCAKKICDKYYIFAPFVVLSLGWVSEYHLSPQSHALILNVVLFYLLILFLTKDSNYWAIILLMNITWLAICISHALTPILTLVALIFMFGTIKLLERVDKNRNELNKNLSQKNNKIYELLYLYVIIFITYVLYQSSLVIDKITSVFKDIFHNLKYGDTLSLVDRAITTPSPSYIYGYKIRLYITLLSISLALICFFVVYSIQKNRQSNIYIGSTYIGYFLFGIVLVGAGYNVYGSDRSYMFSLTSYGIMCSILLNTNAYVNRYVEKIVPYFKIFIVFFTLISVVLLPITHNANDPYNFVSESESAGKNFCLKYQNNITEPSAKIVDSTNAMYSTDPSDDDALKAIYPTPISSTFYTFYYNFIEMKSQTGSKYIKEIESQNIIYNSGQYKRCFIRN